MVQAYQHRERRTLDHRDNQVRSLYLAKRNARHKEVLNYTADLLRVRNSAERQSLASIQQCEEHDQKISELKKVEDRKL